MPPAAKLGLRRSCRPPPISGPGPVGPGKSKMGRPPPNIPRIVLGEVARGRQVASLQGEQRSGAQSRRRRNSGGQGRAGGPTAMSAVGQCLGLGSAPSARATWLMTPGQSTSVTGGGLTRAEATASAAWRACAEVTQVACSSTWPARPGRRATRRGRRPGAAKARARSLVRQRFVQLTDEGAISRVDGSPVFTASSGCRSGSTSACWASVNAREPRSKAPRRSSSSANGTRISGAPAKRSGWTSSRSRALPTVGLTKKSRTTRSLSRRKPRPGPQRPTGAAPPGRPGPRRPGKPPRSCAAAAHGPGRGHGARRGGPP